MTDLSVLVPSRNEMFLQRTIDDILSNIEGDTEIIAVCDGEWPDPAIDDHPRVTLIYHSESVGQRAATNEAAGLSNAKYIMKCDAHCAFDKGFDVKLMTNCEYDWTVVPRMYNLHAFNWKCKQCGNEKYQGPTPTSCEKCDNTTDFEREMYWKPRLSRRSDFMRFDTNLKFNYWRAYGKRPEAQGDIADTMSLIGACWFLERERYWELGGMDEKHGSWGQMGTEIACKAWLSGGRLVVNKKTWFAHMFRTQGGDFGFPFPLKGSDVQKARDRSKQLWQGDSWPKAVHKLDWLIEKFKPIPDWHTEDKSREKKKQQAKVSKTTKKLTKGLIYYTDNHGDERLLKTCRGQILKCMKEYHYPIVSVSQMPIDFGTNFVMDLPRAVLSLYKQVLKGLQESSADIIFMLEHDLLYHPSHFDFTPEKKDTFYYDHNRWAVCDETGKAVFYHTDVPSLLCAYRELLIKHYTIAIEQVAGVGWKSRYGFSPPKGFPKELRVGKAKRYVAKYPSLDIRRKDAWTSKRMDKSQFRNEHGRSGWKEADEVPGWGKIKGRFDDFLRDIPQGE